MKLIVTQSGLKAYTKEHGLTEYWSHRITFCSAPSELPKIFCWVYRHEGRKLKQELRCHAVLCAKESVARQIANQLQARLTQALIEFKRDKISRQNARLSLANSVYENPSLPRRKILLSTGCHNYRPPLERSKSAPKLMAIEESLEEEDECAGLGADLKKSCKPKFATYRNLSYSNRGNRMGGLHGMRVRSATTNNLLQTSSATNAITSDDCATKTVEVPSLRINDVADTTPTAAVHGITNSHETENSSQFDENECCAGEDVVEQNPFGGWKREESLLEAFVREVSLQEKKRYQNEYERMCISDTDTAPSSITTDINENICDSSAAAATKCAYLLENITSASDAGDELPSPCPSYKDSCASRLDCELPPRYDDCMAVGKYDSLVRSRRKMFENGGTKWTDEPKPAQVESSEKDLVKNRRKLFECADQMAGSGCAVTAIAAAAPNSGIFPCTTSAPSTGGDTDSALHFDFSGDEQRDSLEEECASCCANDDDSATPSLQSISSGSDTSSPRDVKLDYTSKNYDLDSLWEEDSDESGFVESIGGQDANDDKIRDLPHHHLMKSCILSSKSQCVEV